MTDEAGKSESPAGPANHGRPNGSARLVDVARLADVSRATAARALGRYGLVGQDTRRKVLEAAKRLNYQTNELARSMRSGRTLTIGVVVAAISNSFFNNTILAVIDTASRYGYQCLILHTSDEIQREIEALRVLRDKRVDGVILVSSCLGKARHLDASKLGRMPIVLLDRLLVGESFAAMTTEDVFGASEAIRHFVANGHKRIGMLVAAQNVHGHTSKPPRLMMSTVRERSSGAEAAMREAGLSFARGAVRYSSNEIDVATEAALAILQLSERPTAILTTNEEMALATVSAARELRLAIGEELSLISIDDTAWLSVFSPAITVVERPIRALAEAAVESLIGQIRTGKPAASARLTPRFIKRHSVRDLTNG